MMFYRVTPGQSPAMIARELGTSVGALIAANSHKPTTVVSGPDGKPKRTFKSLRYNELLHKPRTGVGALAGEEGTLGAVTPADPAAPHALITQGSYGPDVALWQKIIGVTADGNFGSGTFAATKVWQTAHGLYADGKVGQNTWAKALGITTSAPVPVSTSASGGPGLAIAAGAAFAALNSDPSYCTSVARSGTAVNTAVHNFKAAWNVSNPSSPVPIGTGKYESVVATALSSALGGVNVPPGCGAAPGVAPPPIPPGGSPPPPPQVTPVPTPAASGGYSSSQIAAATAMNSALAAHGYKQADQGLYMAFQRAMGLTADGYPGTGTMGKLQAVLASVGTSMAQVPIYPWHAGAWDGKNAPTAASWSGASTPVASRPPVPVEATPPPPQPGTVPTTPGGTLPGGGGTIPSGGGGVTTTPGGGVSPAPGTVVVAPETKKGLSKGAIVVGAIGAAALLGLGAMALTGKKTGHRGARGVRRPARRKSSKHKKPTHHARKPKKRKK